MSQRNALESIDLSALPAVLRAKVQEQLNRMSPEMQQEFLKKSRPMLNRAMDTAKNVENSGIEAVRQANRLKPQGHYNSTVQPGDSSSGQFLKLIGLIIAAAAIYTIFQ